jgi:hypothetical protein
LRTEYLLELFPEHRTRAVGTLGLECRCGLKLTRPGVSVAGRGATLAGRTFRKHLHALMVQKRRARARRQWVEELAERSRVEADRLDVVARGLSLSAFAWACGITRSAAKAWLVSRRVQVVPRPRSRTVVASGYGPGGPQ